jgi:hypothetical protein
VKLNVFKLGNIDTNGWQNISIKERSGCQEKCKEFDDVPT